jgi:hypothetical protein
MAWFRQLQDNKPRSVDMKAEFVPEAEHAAKELRIRWSSQE